MGPRGGTQTRPFPTHPTPIPHRPDLRRWGRSCLHPDSQAEVPWAAGGRIALDQCSTTQASNPLRFDLLNSDLAGEGLCWEGGMLGFLWPGK